MKFEKRCQSLLGLILICAAAACVRVGELTEDSRSVEKGNIQSARIDLNMGAGEMDVRSGAKKLMEGSFFYNVEKWKPEIDFQEMGERGILRVSQGKSKGIPAGRTENRWDIYLNDEILLELSVDFGAGEAKLDLRGLNLRSVNVNMGVGDVRVDVSGSYKQDVEVEIDGGVGSAAIFLPSNIGVRVSVDKGIGSVNAKGFTKRGDFYINNAFGSSDVTINVSIDAGIGSIDLRLK